jgi:hypothetical protein
MRDPVDVIMDLSRTPKPDQQSQNSRPSSDGSFPSSELLNGALIKVQPALSSDGPSVDV